MNQKVVVASDHAGYDLKLKITEYLKEKGYQVKDLGAYSDDSSDYPDFGCLLAEYLNDHGDEVGLSFCGTGNGISMAANKHPEIRSAVCWSPEIARLAKAHNNAHICSLPSRFISDEEAKLIVSSFLEATFEGGRHLRRINKLSTKH